MTIQKYVRSGLSASITKSIGIALLAVSLAPQSHAQTTTLYSNSTSVGIGTTSPANSLDVSTGGGVHLTTGVPGSTTMALYNDNGTLTWNGVPVATTGTSVSGTANYIPVFTASNAIGNSVMYQNGSDIGIGTTSPDESLTVDGIIHSTTGGIEFPDGTIQTTADGGGGSQWTTSGSNIYYDTGYVGIGTSSPAASLDIGNMGTTLGTLRLEGNTSGYVQLQPSAAAGSWTMTLPSSAGTSGYVLQTNGSGTTSWVAQAAGVQSSSGRLQCGGSNCSNTTGSTTLNYCPYKGNIKTTASQGNYTLPSGCLSATTTSMYVGGVSGTSLSSNTLYYIYLWNNSGTWVLDADTTGHATDSTSGIEIKSGDNTKTLVGMIHTSSSGKIMTGGEVVTPGDTNTVATWDNRSPTTTRCGFTASRSQTSNVGYSEVNSENRCYFMSWADAAVFTADMLGSNNTAGGDCWSSIYLDGSVSFAITAVVQPVANYQMFLLSPASYTPTEGYHYTTMYGTETNGTTCTWLGDADTYINVYSVQ